MSKVSFRLSNLSLGNNKLSKEESAIYDLRTKIRDVLVNYPEFNEDLYLLQWLKAQSLKPNKAEKMIRDAIKWRAENDVKALVSQPYPVGLSDELVVNLDGVSKDGALVTTICPGEWPYKESIEKYGKMNVLRYWFQMYARAEELNNVLNRRRSLARKENQLTSDSVTGAIFILDMKNLQLKQLTSKDVIEVALTASRASVNYFPALANKIIFFNVSKIFKIALKVLIPVITGPNQTIDVFEEGNEEWRSCVLESIPEDQIRRRYGGCMED